MCMIYPEKTPCTCQYIQDLAAVQFCLENSVTDGSPAKFSSPTTFANSYDMCLHGASVSLTMPASKHNGCLV